MNRFTQALLNQYLSSAHRVNPSESCSEHLAERHTGTQSGVTLLEALVAMIVITITVAIITPPIFLATATRVSNRRTEQAMQLAQGEIERVRLLMLGSQAYDTIKAELPPIANGARKDTVDEVDAPTETCPPPSVTCSARQLVQTDNDRLLIQTFREDGATVADGSVVAFRMGVRVYGSEALDDNGQPLPGLEKDPSGLKFTTGPGSRVNRPLVVFYTEMIRGTEGGGLSAMKDVAWD